MSDCARPVWIKAVNLAWIIMNAEPIDPDADRVLRVINAHDGSGSSLESDLRAFSCSMMNCRMEE